MNYKAKAQTLLEKIERLGRKSRRVINYSMREKRTGFHTFWTRPMEKIDLQDYEILTMVTSALSYRKHNGPMVLYTDMRGYEWFNQKGLLWLYDQVSCALEYIPEEVSPKIFWAAGKLYAYLHCDVPCVSVDLDAIIWKRLPMMLDDAVALHPEPTNWGGYQQTEDLQKFGFQPEFGWNWKTSAANVGVLMFNDQHFKNFYATKAVVFMLDYSVSGEARRPYAGIMAPNTYTHLEEMIFAEQRLLMMCADFEQKTVGFLSDFDTAVEHIGLNPTVSHLWNSKRGYKVHGEARRTYTNYLLHYLISEFPEAIGKIGKAGIANCLVMDANIPAYRLGNKGEWTLPGERIVKLT